MFDRSYGLSVADMLTHLDFIRPVNIGPSPRAMAGHANNGKSRFSPTHSRHTGKPHEHKREIARNARRAAA